ncbi:nucleotide sugar dehydrogenase [Paenibacillus allorhizosphaerae]|uniref:UDP-N-acetyl-D-glucosamine 6-dehydrogenase n=1 Tax=Paenibacillus allorhizosphaerae TaxID=2849866 RepID=A0ABN7TSA2_9BACL|nr:nucleotide sugar dehydrogenase [Paenibacillus allorhizosphaerae]CAG7649114.1 UDP-N-acetyl-D-glucosamine 6-dehydrogenase [Paenibacillus allorhizosphaerae]
MRFNSAAIIGLGYVGLPLAKLLVENGLHVVGVDLDPSKINKLHAGSSYISDLNDQEIEWLMTGGKFEAVMDYSKIAHVQSVIICVPTPVTEHGAPDLKYVELAGQHIEQIPLNGQLIVLESSTYPGTTEEVLLPILQKNGKRVGEHFYLSYSPERINPGDKRFGLTEMPKIVSGVTNTCLQKITELYSPIYQKVIPVSSPRAAEMAKVMENSQRFINISFMNEIVKFCEKMNIDVWEVIDAANSKPYGNLHFYPGPGIGGHCIPVDPLYLQWKADSVGADLEFIKIAKKVNDSMPDYIVSRLSRLFADSNWQGKSILVLGVTYKKDVNDLRESSALRIMSLLVEKGADIRYHDPIVPSITVDGCPFDSVELTREQLKSADCVLILMDHSGLPMEFIVSNARLVFDTKHATGKYRTLNHIVTL